MKILLLIRDLNCAGAQRQIVTLAKGLQSRGDDIVVATFYANGPLEQDLHAHGVTVRSAYKRGRWDTLGFLKRLISLIRHERPQIIHSYLGSENILVVLLRPLFLNTRVVWGVRSSDVDMHHFDWLQHILYGLETMLSRCVDLIIANSHAGQRNAIARGFPANKIVVIPNGIDTKKFSPDFESRDRLRKGWGIRAEEKLIGLVGRLHPKKDHGTFFRAASIMAQNRSDVRFVCVGDGSASYTQELKTLVAKLGLKERVIWLGQRGDMHAIYNSLDLITSSSAYGEGFANVIGEAMACGVPCVVTNVGDSAWIVGDVGVVIPSKSVHELVEGWNEILGKEKKYNAMAVRERIVQHFSVEALVNRTEIVLAQLSGLVETGRVV